MRAAVANGADAVYFGLETFNARHRAHNFTDEELPRVMEYLHSHNVKGYLTFNVLIFSDELEQAAELLGRIAAARVDAVIVQDLGLARLIRRLAPGLHVHGSTQMTLTEARGVEFVKRQLGVRRVVLARELSAGDVRAIAGQTDVPLEVFVHGALCVAYSGQCLTSESLGGRSANRGQCAQACRLPYELIVDGVEKDIGDKAYLLSPQDLAAYDLVDDLVKVGVSCFKIEGRLKSAEYVAATTQTYRAALDAALVGWAPPTDRAAGVQAQTVGSAHPTFAISDSHKRNLAQTFSRGFTHGFLDGVDHSELVPALFPKSRGIRIGSVAGVTRHGVLVDLDPVSTNGRMTIAAEQVTLKPGDGVVFDEGRPGEPEQGGRIYEVFRGKGGPRSAGAANARVEITFGRDAIALEHVAPGAIVWKTDDPEVRKQLEQSYSRDVVARRVPVTAHVEARLDRPIRLTLTDAGDVSGSAESAQPLVRAQKHPLTVEALRDQLARLGDTPFELAGVTAEPLEPVMAPKSVLNELRRQAVEALLAARAKAGSVEIAEADALERLRTEVREIEPVAWRPHAGAGASGDGPDPLAITTNDAAITVLCRSLDQLTAVAAWSPTIRLDTVYCDFEDVRKYKDAVAVARENRLPIALATTRVIKPSEEGLLRQVAAHEPDALLVRNLAGLTFFAEEFPHIPLLGDYSLNVTNELTAGLYHAAGLRRLVPGYDLNWRQLSAMLGRVSPALFEAVIHQHMPMFHMEHCVFCHALSTGKDYRDCGRPCDTHRVDLRDRTGKQHPLIADVGCRNTVFNATAQSAAELVPKMRELGVRVFRLELLRQDAAETTGLLDRYADVIAGRADGGQAVRSLRVLSQLGVSRGTFDFE
ncbi:MAG TPA: DUF3656 domain-containing protein [Tepidisphaeraceae bacterium]|nr:DUF3656 domain-containing protein [Tepidisphaeraceae bacterium]